MNLSQLRYFRKLAEVQHFTRAAEALFITQPALSNSIKQLENELGIPLFEQHGRNVRLTKYGKEFNEYVSEGLDVIDKGIQVAQEHANSLSGTIDIGTIFTVQFRLFTSIAPYVSGYLWYSGRCSIVSGSHTGIVGSP